MMVSKRILRRWHPKLRALVEDLGEQGYTLEHGGKHVIVRCPLGRRVGTIAVTPSDHRAQLNSVSDIRRAIASN